MLIAIGAYFAVYDDWPGAGFGDASTQAYAQAYAKETDGATPGAAPNRPAADSVDLSDQQLASVKVEPVREHVFPIEKSAVGSIDFNQELSVQVFTPYQGRIVGLFATIGDEVKKGQTLFTIDSPDLLQAVSILIAAAGVLEFTTRNLARLKALYATRAVSQKDMEQAVSDQQTAEGNVRAGRDAVRLFGKTDAEINSIIAKRMADSILVVPSPISGRVTARNAAPGLYVQPGNAPAPFSVADISTMWMLANVAELDSPAFKVGQDVRVNVMAFPGREFDGRISTISSIVEPEHTQGVGALRNRRPAARIARRDVRDFHHSRGRPGTLPSGAARWRRARGRWNHDSMGHRGSPAFHQANRQDWPATRRLSTDP